MQEEVRKNQNETWNAAHCCSLGNCYVKWGLGFFILGLIFGFGVLIHYLVGSSYENSSFFLTNMSLWFGSPLSLSVTYLQLGGLAMAIIGATCHVCGRCCGVNATAEKTTTCPSSYKRKGGLTLCKIGLIALFITGYIGYFAIDYIWPGFYYTPVQAGKNLWLILQGLSILCFTIGVIIATCYICCCCKRKSS